MTTTSHFKKIVLICLCLSYYFLATAIPIKEKNKIGAVVKNDPLPAQKVITKFLQWYKINLHKANSFPLLNKDSAGNYMVNKKAVSEYLNFLKSSKFISGKYIAHWQIYFDDKAAELNTHPIKSDMPEGFDFDFILITQEPETVLNQLSRLKFKTVSINKAVALIGVTLPSDKSVQYEFEMYKVKDDWQIGYISTPNYD